MVGTDLGDPDGREVQRGEDRPEEQAGRTRQEARGPHPDRHNYSGFLKSCSV